MNDRIELTGIRALGIIGVLPEERERAQPFEVDLVLETDLAEAGATDDLALTVHYGEATEKVLEVLTTESPELIERVAYRIAERMFEFERVDAVEVTVRKLRPPVPAHMEHSAVAIRRTREPERSRAGF